MLVSWFSKKKKGKTRKTKKKNESHIYFCCCCCLFPDFHGVQILTMSNFKLPIIFLETNTWVLGVLIVAEVSFTSRLIQRWELERDYVFIPICIHIYIYLSIYIKNYEIILILLNPVHQHLTYSCHLHMCKSFLWRWGTWILFSTIYLLICLTLEYSNVAVLWIYSSVKINLPLLIYMLTS